MVLGMTLTAYTILHVILSVIGIATGLVVVGGLLAGSRLPLTTAIFLITTLATTLGGFLFPFNGFTPAIGVGIVSTIVLLITIAARYVYRLQGSWRWIYVGGAVLSLYLNSFVLVVQSFLKVPDLNIYAPDRLGAALRDHAGHRARRLHRARRAVGGEVQAGGGLTNTPRQQSPSSAAAISRFTSKNTDRLASNA